MKRALVLSIVILGGLIACQKKESTTTGNPLVSLKMTSSTNSTAVAVMNFGRWLEGLFFPRATAAAPPPLVDKNNNVVTLDQGWMVVREIEFEATEVADVSETDGDDVKLVGPYVVDLFAASPDLIGQAEVTTSSIRRIKMKMHKLESATDGAPGPLVSNSIYFHGSLAGKEFILSSEDGTEFEVGGPTALTVSDGMPLLLTIKIVPLIAKIDMSHLVSQSAPIVINDNNKGEAGSGVYICPEIDNSATTVFDCFRKGLEEQAQIGNDSDGSGEIEDDEESVK
jgi:hypothetical protein